MVQGDVHIRQNTQGDIVPVNLGQGFRQTEMGRMRFFAQRVHDPALHALQQRPRCLGQLIDVRRVSQITDPEAEGIDAAVAL